MLFCQPVRHWGEEPSNVHSVYYTLANMILMTVYAHGRATLLRSPMNIVEFNGIVKVSTLVIHSMMDVIYLYTKPIQFFDKNSLKCFHLDLLSIFLSLLSAWSKSPEQFQQLPLFPNMNTYVNLFRRSFCIPETSPKTITQIKSHSSGTDREKRCTSPVFQ